MYDVHLKTKYLSKTSLHWAGFSAYSRSQSSVNIDEFFFVALWLDAVYGRLLLKVSRSLTATRQIR